jgi:hypothetical protein
MAKYKKGDVVKIRQDLKEDVNYYMDDGESYNDYTEDMSGILGEYVTIEGVADMGYDIKGSDFYITDEMVDQSIAYYKCLVDDYSDLGISIKKETIYPADYCICSWGGDSIEDLVELYPEDWEKVESKSKDRKYSGKFIKGDVIHILRDIDHSDMSWDDYRMIVCELLGRTVVIEEDTGDGAYSVEKSSYLVTEDMIDRSIDYYMCKSNDYNTSKDSPKKGNIYPTYYAWITPSEDSIIRVSTSVEIFPSDWEKVDMSEWINDKAWNDFVFNLNWKTISTVPVDIDENISYGNMNTTGVEYTREANISYGDMNTTSVYNYEFDEDGYMYPLSGSSEDRVEIEKPTLFTSEMDKINILLQQIILCKAELEELESQLEEKENEYGIKFNID